MAYPDGGSFSHHFLRPQSVESIETHIAKDLEELAEAEASGDQAKARHYGGG